MRRRLRDLYLSDLLLQVGYLRRERVDYGLLKRDDLLEEGDHLGLVADAGIGGGEEGGR